MGSMLLLGSKTKSGNRLGERSQLLGIQPKFLHEGRSIERKDPAILPAADTSAQLIDQVWSNGIVVRDHDLIVMFEIGFRGKGQTGRADKPLILVAPAAENTLLRVNRVVDSNIELIGKDRIGNVDDVIKIASALIWKRVKLRIAGALGSNRVAGIMLPGKGVPSTSWTMVPEEDSRNRRSA